MISEHYKNQLQQKHSTDKWGTTGGRNFGSRLVEFLKLRPEIKTVMDFGAGHCSLMRYVETHSPELFKKLIWTNYDPGVPELSKEPTGLFDLVVSSDVLEHVEPDELKHVRKWLYDRTKLYMYHLIACDPCAGTLPDGRNAHLIVEEPVWWKNQLSSLGSIMYWADEIVLKRGVERHYCCIQIDKTG